MNRIRARISLSLYEILYKQGSFITGLLSAVQLLPKIGMKAIWWWSGLGSRSRVSDPDQGWASAFTIIYTQIFHCEPTVLPEISFDEKRITK